MTAVHEWAGPDALERASGVDELLSAVGAPVTARRPWLGRWAEAYPDWEPWVVAIGPNAGSLEAAALLARRRTAGVTQVTGLAHGATDRSRCLVSATVMAAEALADALASRLRSLRGPWSLVVEQLPEDEPAAPLLVARAPCGQVERGDGCPVLPIDVRDPAAYVKKKVRRDLRQARERLEAEGAVATVEHLSTPEAVLDALPTVVALHRARDHDVGRPSALDDDRRRRFYLEAVGDLARCGAAEATFVRIDGAIAAYELSLLDGATYRLFDGRMATPYARFNPGHLATEAILRRVVDDPRLEAIDWMRGEQPYKLHMARHVDGMVEVRAWSSAAVRTVADAPRWARARFRQVRAEHPAVARAWKAVRR